MKTSAIFADNPENTSQTLLAGGCPDRGFTVVELLVVLGMVAMLALVLVPALASTKTDTWLIQCQDNLKQLQVGFQLFARDHNDMFPPAGVSNGGTSGSGRQLAWDAYIHHYFGDTNSDASWSLGIMLASPLPAVGVGAVSPTMGKIEVCPADRFPKVSWLTGPPAFALRSYAMNSVGPNWGTQYQVSTQNGIYLLPDLNQPGYHGVGIYWQSSALLPDWDAKGYKTSVVKDPSGTILLCEETGGQQCVGNIWTCVCNGPQTSQHGGVNGNLYQIDTTSIPQNPNSAAGVNQGSLLYNAQGGRFNYAFHDGHVAALKIEQTVGTGTLSAPKGMWTVAPGD
ncbi:MAG TPA: type II secretion system protein [Candidatus Limnocylindrales bacterium]|nr:type II secretion system protein [Candidatus Limnocylindrales bacterium]